MHKEQYDKEWSKIIVNAWSDENFKKRLLSDPMTVLKEHGIKFPQGVTCMVQENTKNEIHLTLPMEPQGALSEEELLKIAAAATSLTYK